MDTNKVYSKLKELGHSNSKRVELQEYCSIKFDLIIKLLPRYIINSDGADILDSLFNGIAGITGDSTENRNKVKVIDIVLKVMRKESTSLTHCGDVISRLCLELPRMPASELVRWCNDSVQSIVDNSDVNMIWRDILPECTSALSAHDTIKHCDTEMSSEEYKDQCVHTLCQCRWTEQQLVQLAAMFKDMRLSKASHTQVVNKICSYIIDLPPDTLPPLIHQLLKLCKTYNLEIVLAHLSYYFGVRLYSKLEPPPQDSESTMDIDDIVQYSSADLSRCLSTCIYHITQGAVEPDLVKRHIKSWPRTQLLRSPFIIDLALAISDKGADFRSVCLDAIKSAIEQRECEALLCKESAWARAVIPPDVDVASVLKLLTTESANHRQLTVMGLINLAFCLLGVSRVKPCATVCWSHGKLILVRICKSQPETAGYVLGQLADRLATDNTHRQYADCLYILCKLSPVSVERCPELGTILASCQPAAEHTAARAVLDAVHPLLSFSTRTRDVLVMVCRKGLYSRECRHRQLALSGFLSVLRHIRVSAVRADSQRGGERASAHSYLTQLTLDVHATQCGEVVTSRVRNEAMCMEILSILRRCLVQDAAVKQLLYTDIYDCGKDKSVLHECILELLHEHLVKYLSDGTDDRTLLLDKCVQINGANAVLVEPIPRLLFAISQYLQPHTEESDDILSSQCDALSAHLHNKLNSILNNLCDNREWGNVDMEDPGLTDITPESKAKSIKVQLILQCYEALIAHKIMQCNPSTTDFAETVGAMFRDCHQLLEEIKAPPKLNKKNKLNETKDTVKSQKSQKSQKDKGKGPVKVASLMKDRSGPFRPLPCVWDMGLCVRVMELLYSESVSWCPIEARNSLRSRRELHQWALRCVTSVCGQADRRTAPQLLTVASVLYHRCLCRFESMCEFDEQTALATLELFKTCLTILLSDNFSLKLEYFLPKITGLSDNNPSTNIATILEHVYTAMQQLDSEQDSDERDVMSKKLLSTLISIATVLLEVPVQCCVNMCNMLLKLEQCVRSSKQECISLVPALLTASARENQDSQLLTDLIDKLKEVLGTIDEDESSIREESGIFPCIEERNAPAVLSALCACVCVRVRRAHTLLQRAQHLAGAVRGSTPARAHRVQAELVELYKSIVVESCQCTVWAGGLCSVRAGGGSGAVAAALRLYNLLAALAKHIPVEIVTHVRLERLLKLSGKKLSSIMDNLITYLEASQTDQNPTKVLRDTKLIPRLVLEAEQYAKNVILLSNKAKLNWQQYMSLGTARDFRIKGPVLEEVLNARENINNDNNRDEDTQDINDAVTEVLSLVAAEDESPRKRRRVS